MSESVSTSDRVLLLELGRVAHTADPVPDLVFDAAYAAFALRDLDAELARLVEDTSMAAAGVRSSGTDTRLLSFETEHISIELQVTSLNGRSTLLGQVVPVPLAGTSIRLDVKDGTQFTVPVDDLGGFRFDDVIPGLVRLHVTVPGAAAVTTQWAHL